MKSDLINLISASSSRTYWKLSRVFERRVSLSRRVPETVQITSAGISSDHRRATKNHTLNRSVETHGLPMNKSHKKPICKLIKDSQQIKSSPATVWHSWNNNSELRASSAVLGHLEWACNHILIWLVNCFPSPPLGRYSNSINYSC